MSTNTLIANISDTNNFFIHSCDTTSELSIQYNDLDIPTGTCLAKTIQNPVTGNIKIAPYVTITLTKDKDVHMPPSDNHIQRVSNAYITKFRESSLYNTIENHRQIVLGTFNTKEAYAGVITYVAPSVFDTKLEFITLLCFQPYLTTLG